MRTVEIQIRVFKLKYIIGNNGLFVDICNKNNKCVVLNNGAIRYIGYSNNNYIVFKNNILIKQHDLYTIRINHLCICVIFRYYAEKYIIITMEGDVLASWN